MWKGQPRITTDHHLVMPIPFSGCMIWMGHVSNKGYASTCFNDEDGVRRGKPIHRIVYETMRGPIPQGLFLDHLCRVPSCVNPDHLEPVTPRENIIRAVPYLMAKRTHCTHGHEFTPENVVYRNGGQRKKCRICEKANWTKRNRMLAERKRLSQSSQGAAT